jgi:hypothetical protein
MFFPISVRNSHAMTVSAQGSGMVSPGNGRRSVFLCRLIKSSIARAVTKSPPWTYSAPMLPGVAGGSVPPCATGTDRGSGAAIRA